MSEKVSAVFFGVLWTLGMIWWTGTETANVVIFSLCGIAAAIAWYFAMRWWIRHRASGAPKY